MEANEAIEIEIHDESSNYIFEKDECNVEMLNIVFTSGKKFVLVEEGTNRIVSKSNDKYNVIGGKTYKIIYENTSLRGYDFKICNS